MRALQDILETALYEHRADALTCYDHDPTPERRSWCCVCGEHNIIAPWRRHVAEKITSIMGGEPGCRHCGKPPEADGDHSCPCPYRDEECLDHPLSNRVPS